nr:MAG TPA: hypothetical protein [Bacteriophage sp.]
MSGKVIHTFHIIVQYFVREHMFCTSYCVFRNIFLDFLYIVSYHVIRSFENLIERR